MPLLWPLLLSAALFGIGVYGVLARRNAVLALMGVELMLNAANLNLVAFDVWLRDVLVSGQVFTLFTIALAAAEIGLGLAIVLRLFRAYGHIDVDRVGALPVGIAPQPHLSGMDAAPDRPAGGTDVQARREVGGGAR
jgi:NADH-quinone oxidoreductase subunit K